jgi:hypothetical protein
MVPGNSFSVARQCHGVVRDTHAVKQRQPPPQRLMSCHKTLLSWARSQPRDRPDSTSQTDDRYHLRVWSSVAEPLLGLIN